MSNALNDLENDPLKDLESSPSGTLSKLAPLVDTAVKDIPFVGAANEVAKHPTIRRAVQSGAGMGAGASVGMALGGPTPAGAGLSIVGAGAGNVIGGEIADITDHPEHAKMAFNFLFNSPQAGQDIAKNFQTNPDETIQAIKQEFNKAGIRFTSGAVAQVLTLGLQGLIPGSAEAVAKGVIPGAKEALEERGVTPTPDMYTNSRLASVTKNIMNRSQAGVEFNAKNEVALNDYTKDLTTDMAGGLRENIPPSELVKKIIAPKQELGEPLQREIEKSMYSKLDDLIATKTSPVEGVTALTNNRFTGVETTPGVIVPTAPINDAIDELSPIAKAGRIGRVANNMQASGRYISFQDAHAWRSDLLDLARSTDDPSVVGPAKMLIEKIDSTMSDAAKGAGKDVYGAWRDANAFVKAGRTAFNNDITAKWAIMDDSVPERLGARLVDNGTVSHVQQLKAVAQRVEDLVNDPKNAEELQKVIAQNPDVQKLIDNKEYTVESVMNKYRKGVLQNLFSRYTNPSPDSLIKSKVNYQGMLGEFDPEFNPEGAEVYKELWGKEKLANLKDTLTAGYRAIQKNPVAYDRAMMWGGRVLSGAVGGMVGEAVGHPGLGIMVGEGAYLLGEGKVASYLLTDPKASKLFTQGLNALVPAPSPITAASTKVGIDLIIKAAREAADEQLIPTTEEK